MHGFAVFAGAFAHFFEAVVDELEFHVVHIDAFGFELEYPHFLELEADAAAIAEVAMAFCEMGFDIGDGADVVIGGGFHEEGDTMGGIAFVEDLVVVGHFLALGTLDGGFDAVLWHVDALGVLHAAAEGGIGGGVGAAGFDGDGDFLSDTRKLFGHPVPAGEHGGLSDFKYATHRIFFFFGGWQKYDSGAKITQ